jgi:hypothetical protein
MFRDPTSAVSWCGIPVAALILALSQASVAAAQSGSPGSFNTATGAGALISNTTGSSNTATGVNGLALNTTGGNNSATGVNALLSNTTGSNATAAGVNALFSNTVGNNNTAFGVNALVFNTTGANNTASGLNVLFSNTTGTNNVAAGLSALSSNTTGSNNTASGTVALNNNRTGSFNAAVGFGADVAAGNLINATAIGSLAVVDASNKIRLGNGAVAVIEGTVAFTSNSDRTRKENFQPTDGEEVLAKIRGFALTSWNFIGHDPEKLRHYGPMAQDFFAAFGHDGIGQIGSETTINAGDMAGILMIAVQALEKRTAELRLKAAQMAVLESQIEDLRARQASMQAVMTRLEALERRTREPSQATAGKGSGGRTGE